MTDKPEHEPLNEDAIAEEIRELFKSDDPEMASVGFMDMYTLFRYGNGFTEDQALTLIAKFVVEHMNAIERSKK
ncbi:hypothetical protein GMA3_68 [Gordonia phage GMA3]|uniref:Uncharacterized protein n=1 Tax=Gordonia phage GMA3 TaxID=1647284 RepID=A0A0K0NKL3_9CAUD|nr:hypothetical protein AU105_gp068 [Gordonia phage GMA3]AKL88245.1 hypothetical protein GMA3_68 [Gordonia phage GMA3]